MEKFLVRPIQSHQNFEPQDDNVSRSSKQSSVQSSVHASQKAGQGQVELAHIAKLIELVNHLVSKSQSTLSIIVN